MLVIDESGELCRILNSSIMTVLAKKLNLLFELILLGNKKGDFTCQT